MVSEAHPAGRGDTHFIKAQPFSFTTPGKAPQEVIVVPRRIPKASEIFAEHDDSIRAFLLGFCDALKLVETVTSGFVVTSDNDLLLLNSERQVP